MRASRIRTDDTPRPPERSTVILMFGTIADTTWRMFVPTIGLLLIGLWIDTLLNTIPSATILLCVIGCLISIELIKRQLRNVNK